MLLEWSHSELVHHLDLEVRSETARGISALFGHEGLDPDLRFEAEQFVRNVELAFRGEGRPTIERAAAIVWGGGGCGKTSFLQWYSYSFHTSYFAVDGCHRFWGLRQSFARLLEEHQSLETTSAKLQAVDCSIFEENPRFVRLIALAERILSRFQSTITEYAIAGRVQLLRLRIGSIYRRVGRGVNSGRVRYVVPKRTRRMLCKFFVPDPEDGDASSAVMAVDSGAVHLRSRTKCEVHKKHCCARCRTSRGKIAQELRSGRTQKGSVGASASKTISILR